MDCISHVVVNRLHVFAAAVRISDPGCVKSERKKMMHPSSKNLFPLLVFSIVLAGSIACAGSLPANQAAQSILSIPVSLSFDASYYRSSQGGNLQNGCEGWQTLTKASANIFASRCDSQRLEKLGLHADAALGFNASETTARKITGSDPFIMLDFTDEKDQALYGLTANKTDAYIILDTNQKYIYFRASGSSDKLKEMGFLVDAILAANNTLNANEKINASGSQLNLAEEKANGSQILIGATTDGKIAAVEIDKNGQLVNRSN